MKKFKESVKLDMIQHKIKPVQRGGCIQEGTDAWCESGEMTDPNKRRNSSIRLTEPMDLRESQG